MIKCPPILALASNEEAYRSGDYQIENSGRRDGHWSMMQLIIHDKAIDE